MSWGRKLAEVDEDCKLLYWVLLWTIAPHKGDSIDYFMKKILQPGGGGGGDPGWEIEHLISPTGPGSYYVWADPEISCIEPAEREYSADVFLKVLKDSLLEYGSAYPEKTLEVEEVIRSYRL